MPFTAAHPAIVLPLLSRSRWFSTTGLIIGSMAPDFEYFIRLRTTSLVSHSFTGIFLFDLPIAFLLASLFHMVVRDQVMPYLPKFLCQRAAGVRRLNWLLYLSMGGWKAFILSACLGAASHIFWDSFTHPTYYFVQKIDILWTTITIFDRVILVCRVVQYASTFIGFIAILYYVLRLKPKVVPDTVSTVKKVGFWILLGMAGVAFTMVMLKMQLTPGMVRGTVVSFLTGIMLATSIYSFFAKLKNA